MPPFDFAVVTPLSLLLLAIVLLAAGLACAWGAPRLWLAATLAAAAASLAAAVWVLASGDEPGWIAPFTVGGDAFRVRLDALSAFFLALLSLLGGVATLYSRAYWSDAAHPRSASTGRAWWNLFLAGMGFILLATNGLHFLIAWELFTISAYFLITLDRRRRDTRAAGWLYLAASHVSLVCLFAFFASLAAQTGSWELGPMRDRAALAPLFWLALVGFGVKAGLFPLHVWLPSAHANAPTHVSTLLSGVALKIGIYGLMRFSGWLPVPHAAAWTVAALGVASAVLGVAFALGQHDLKRLLAYHSVENIGIILIGLGFALIAAEYGHPAWAILAFAGALLHVWNHGLFKGLLFLGAGSVLHATGTREMSRLGGLWRAMPWTAALFVVGAAAISGLPPLNGFVSEWLVFLGLFDAVTLRGPAAWAAVPAAILLGMTGALALACFVKVCGVVFLGTPRTEAARHAHECGWSMRVPMVVLALACAAIGVGPAFLWPAITRATLAWQPQAPVGAVVTFRPPAALVALGAWNAALIALGLLAAVALSLRLRRNGVRRAPTWGCGYAAPTARMQYTAGSFASIITGWFGWILRPRRRAELPAGLFPSHAAYEERTPETVLEEVVEPAGRGVLAAASALRRLQHGRLQAYILYIVVALAALALLVFPGMNP
ncbi:MAG TPA: proton-conducting transporter membrane subunit [Candidatus Eisenbacteria bacterium]|nr:proton-conducting transporter membrane subunit [Candidatus Eisenbacteria bacterium]